MSIRDLRIAARVVAQKPLPAALSVLSIALGIGLTTAVFSLADALLLRPFSVARPTELFTITSIGDDGAPFMYAWQDYENMAHSGVAFSAIAAYQRRGGMLANADGGSDMVLVSPATPNYFSLLGVPAALGRASLHPVAGRPAAVIGWSLWQRHLGGDPAIVGKSIVLDRNAFTVAGVLPREFGGLERGVANDIWLSTDAWFDVLHHGDRRDRFDQFEFVVRLNPGSSRYAAAAQLDASIRGPGKRKPAPAGSPGTILDANFAPTWCQDILAGGGLIVVLALVLFVACANVAQLRLAQSEASRKQTAIRLALGESASAVLRRLLLETALLAIPGAALGLLFAKALLVKAVELLTAGRTFLDAAVRLDARVVAFTTAATVLSILLAGLPAARLVSRLSIAEIIKSEQGATAAGAAWRRQVLIAGQTAITVTLLGITLLFLQSMHNAARIRPGFEPDKNLLLIEAVPGRDVPRAQWAEQVCERLQALPGARSATFARRLALSDSGGGAAIRIEMPGQAPRSVHYNNVAENFFHVMGTRVLAGRGIDSRDRENAAPVIVASQTFVREFVPAGNPLGQSIPVGHKLWQIVGIAEDAPSNQLHETPEPFLYFSYAQMPADDLTLIVETSGVASGSIARLAHPIVAAIRRFDPGALLYDQRTLRQHMDAALAQDRLMTTTATVLGMFSIALLAAGVFGMLQYAVARRTRELGVRMALGASARAVRMMVLTDAFRIAAYGVPIGLGLLAALAWWARSLVLGVSPLSPGLYIGSAMGTLLLALGASWIPAVRATRVDPMKALREM